MDTVLRAFHLLSAIFAESSFRPIGECRVKEALTDKDLAWEEFIRIAGEELILPALQARLQVLNIASLVPSEVADFLSAVEELNLERNRAIFSELATVATFLNSSGIEPALLKGASYFVTGMYANLATRYLGDVDLLIPESQLAAAVEILIQNGFESAPNDRLGRFRHHYPPLKRKGCIAFELHDSLGLGVCKSLLPASEMLQQSVSRDFHGARVRLPSPSHLMLHLILHSQMQHPYNERIWPPLRAMCDLVALRHHFEGEIDWGAIEHRFRKTGQFGCLALHLLQVQESLGAEVPFPIKLTGIARARWLRRRLLRTHPKLRFFDPIYMCSTVFTRRFRLVRNACATPGGWRHVARELVAPAFYRRLLTDIVEGYGR